MRITTIILLIFVAVSVGRMVMMQGELNTTRESLATAVAMNDNLAMDIQSITTKYDQSRLDLRSTQNDLNDTRNQLSNTESDLQTTNDELADTRADLTTTQNNLQTTRQSLTETRYQLTSAQSQLYEAESLNLQMQSDYSELRDTINARWDWRENAISFVTPANSAVVAQAHYLAGDFVDSPEQYWPDLNRLYNWVASSVEYDTDTLSPVMPYSLGQPLEWSHDFWKTPEETLTDMTGDCEDMATLLASMMIAYNQDTYAVWVIGIENGESAHAAVGFPVKGDRFTIADPAGHYYTGMASWYASLVSEPIEKCITNWLNHWAREMPGARINFIFSNDYFREFSSNQEFIDWVKSR